MKRETIDVLRLSVGTGCGVSRSPNGEMNVFSNRADVKCSQGATSDAAAESLAMRETTTMAARTAFLRNPRRDRRLRGPEERGFPRAIVVASWTPSTETSDESEIVFSSEIASMTCGWHDTVGALQLKRFPDSVTQSLRCASRSRSDYESRAEASPS
jgi:hypothetical protein